MLKQKFAAYGLVGLLVLSVCLAITPHSEALKESTNHFVGTHQDQTFTDGSTSIAGTVGASILPSIPVAYGHSLTSGTVQIDLEGTQQTHSDAYTVASGALNGSLVDVEDDGTSIQLMSASSGPPQAGQNSSTVLSTTNLAGTHSYDTLELLCGIASCGRIVATGDLTLYVNTLKVEQGTAIVANDLTTGGQGAGSSTTTSTSGRNDGGGGAGHGGSGGSGGGTNGGSGGSTYGNGTERGSQGGTVSSSYHATATGGKGGGYIQIFANQIFVNGTIQAHGGDGTAGSQASSGTGAGGSGGGGGSGGSIFIKANSVLVGNGGQIKADGGDGGDGANGAQNGPGFGMYDGGDGGGGGGGGRIVISTQSGAYTNSGTVNALGGSGGSKGLKYGTGVDGVDGSAGSNGVVSTSTWQGYMSSSNTTSDNGTFTTNPLETQPLQPSTAYITHGTSVPSDASLTASYRTTLNGTGSSWDEWSDWAPLSLSGQWVERHRWIQVEYSFARTGSSSPSLTSMTVQHTSWTTLQSPDLRYDGETLQPSLSATTLGLTTTMNASGASTSPQFSIEIPEGASFTDDLSFWMNWPTATSGSTPSFSEASIGGTVLNATQQPHHTAGIDITLPKGLLNAASASNTWTDAQGLGWNTLTVDIAMTSATDVWFGHLSVPWSFSGSVEVTDAVNDVVLYECGSFYAFTNPSCFGSATSHPLTLTGSTLPIGAPAFTYTLSQPAFSWEDSYAPEITSIQHRQGVEQLPDIRVNESFSVVVFDGAGEDDLTIEFLGLNWDPSQGFANAQPLAYHNALMGYYLYLNTDGLEVDLQHEYNMTFRVVDANGNERLPRPTYNFTVYPVMPSVSSVSITGPTKISGLGTVNDPMQWGIGGAVLTIDVNDAHQRETLVVVAELTHSSATQPMFLPLFWNPELRTYSMDWFPTRDDLGDWQLEISMSEIDGLEEHDDDGWLTGADVHLRLVDALGPVITTIEHPTAIEQGEPLVVNLTWTGEVDESYSGSIAILLGGVEVANKSILETALTTTGLMFDTSSWDAGMYSVIVSLQDDVGNSAVNDANASLFVEVLKPWLVHDLTLAIEDQNNLRIQGAVEARSGTSILTIAQEEGEWNASASIVDGDINLTYIVSEVLAPASNFSVVLCDATGPEDCEVWSVTLDFTDAFSIDVSSQCTLHLINESSSMRQSIVTCSVSNNGLTAVDGRLVFDAVDDVVPTNISLAPGETGTALLELLEGDGDVNKSLAWTMLVTNSIGGQKILEMGQVDVVRSLPASVTENEDDPVSNEGTGLLTPVIIVLVLVGILTGSITIYRKGGASNEVEKLFDEAHGIPSAEVETEGTSSEEPTSNMTEPAYPAAPVTPPATAQPTSVDEHGFEWYSTAEGHWYRPAQSGADWTPYEA